MLVHTSLTYNIPVTGIINIPDDVTCNGADAVNRYIEEHKEDVTLSKEYNYLRYSQKYLSPVKGQYNILQPPTVRQLAELKNTTICVIDNSITDYLENKIFLSKEYYSSYSVVEYTVEDIVVGYGFFAKGFAPTAHTRNILATQPMYHHILKGSLEVIYMNDTGEKVDIQLSLPPQFPDDWYILCYTDEGYNHSTIVGVEIIAKSAALYEELTSLANKIKDYKLNSYICTNCGATNMIEDDGTNIVYTCNSCGRASTFKYKYGWRNV